MFFPWMAAWVVALLWLWPGAASPVGSASASAADVAGANTLTLKRRVEEVRVTFAVRDGRRLVRNLKSDRLTFLDNGTPPAAVTTFREDSDVPLQVALVIDHSDSVQKGFAGEQDAAVQFLEKFLRPKIDSVFVVEFAARVRLHEPAADQVSILSRGVGELEASGQTALYDAMLTTAGVFERQLPVSGPVRRVVLLLSDGEDNFSRANFSDAVEAIQRADATIYALTAHSSHYEYRGDPILRQMTKATGGKAFILRSYSGAGEAFSQIADELRTQYSVTYRPPVPRTCGFHTIRIVPRDGKLRVSAREGYYACSE